MVDTIELRKKMLLYRSLHRGCKETDIILGRFALTNLTDMTEQDLDDYENIVETEDCKLYDYITEKLPIPGNLNRQILMKIRNFKELS